MDNIYYNIWKQYILDRLTELGVNYGVIGERVTSIDDWGRTIGSVNLDNAWKNHYGFIDILDILW